MFKTFIFGILLGIAATGALLYFVPAVDQHREASLISVQANGGNSEAFHINLPEDRILAGKALVDAPVPAGLEWPANGILADAEIELFKIRDSNESVVGVASRMAGPVEAADSMIEWTLHLPARGTMYVAMPETPGADGYRNGAMRAGTREFADLHGSVRERFIEASLPAESVASSDIEGRIELATALTGTADEDE